MPTPGILLAGVAVGLTICGGTAVVKATNHHVVQPVKHAIVRIVKKVK